MLGLFIVELDELSSKSVRERGGGGNEAVRKMEAWLGSAGTVSVCHVEGAARETGIWENQQKSGCLCTSLLFYTFLHVPLSYTQG